MTEKYNGWTNYETWNVALWLQNDEYYNELCKTKADYKSVRELLGSGGTPDGVSWCNTNLNLNELDKLIDDLSE